MIEENKKHIAAYCRNVDLRLRPEKSSIVDTFHYIFCNDFQKITINMMMRNYLANWLTNKSVMSLISI